MSEKKRTKRQSILVEQVKAGRITLSSPHSAIEVAFAYQCAALPGLPPALAARKENCGYGRIQHIMAITSDQRTYSFQGETAAQDFLAKFVADHAITRTDDAVLRPNVAWLGFRPKVFLDHLRLALTPHFPYHAQHHLVDFLPYAVGSWASTQTPPHVFMGAIKNLYGYELPESWEQGTSVTADLKLITEVLSRQKVWE